MIVVKVELHSAITHKVTEIGRMVISNDCTGTAQHGDYTTRLMRRGTTNKVQKIGEVKSYPRQAYSIWKLVLRALNSVGLK